MRKFTSNTLKGEDEQQEDDKGIVTYDISRKIIYIDGVIEKDMHYLFNASVDELKLAYTDEETEECSLDEINVKINSVGGNLNACLRIIEEINRLKDEGIIINTYAEEECSSCGCFILTCGTNRYAYVNSHIVAHRPLLQANKGVAITYDILKIWKKDLDDIWTPIKEILEKNTKTPKKEYNKMNKGFDLEMTPKIALEYGYVDKILSI